MLYFDFNVYFSAVIGNTKLLYDYGDYFRSFYDFKRGLYETMILVILLLIHPTINRNNYSKLRYCPNQQ